MNSKAIIKKIYFVNLILVFFVTSCTKLVAVDGPVTSISASNVFASDATAVSALTGIYSNVSSGSLSIGSFYSLPLLAGLSADEFTLYSGSTNTSFIQYYTNALTNAVDINSDPWFNMYPYIYNVNAAIEGLQNNDELTPAVRQQILGEAKFMRAFFYFYLVNLYGEVPLVNNTDYKVNQSLSRTSKELVYQQIISDLLSAQDLLSINYLDGTVLNTTLERVRPTKWAATALLARAYLFDQKWDSAETQASQLINNNSLFSLDSLNSVFLANSTEAIWQLQPVNNGENTQDAILYILPASGPTDGLFPVYLNRNLINSFEPGDQRKIYWVDSVLVDNQIYYYPYKYKINTLNAPVTEYPMIFRLAEQFLIRAEARAQKGNVTGSQSDLNVIRNRAGLSNSSAADQSSLLSAILHERQVELFTEWGNRWLDLKRTKTIDSVMNVVTPIKGGAWNSNWQLYPIPANELSHNPNLVQNAGY